MPVWNEFSAKYFIGDQIRVISGEELWEDLSSYNPECKNTYVLDQTTVEREVVFSQIKQIENYGFSFIELASNENQTLYLLE